MKNKITILLLGVLSFLSIGELFKRISFKRPPMPPHFQREILEIIWDNRDRLVASHVCRDRVIAKFTLRNLFKIWLYQIRLKLYKIFK